MYFKVPCPHCGKNLKVSDEHIGKKAGCPYCKTTFQIQRPETELPPPVPVATPVSAEQPAAPAGWGPPEEMPPEQIPLEQIPSAPPGRVPSFPEGGRSRSAGPNVNLALTGLVAIGATAVFYVAFVLPLHKTYVGELFHDRGWVPYVIVLLTAWAACMLVQKGTKIAKQKRSLLFDVLPTELSPEIRRDNVDIFQNHIASLPADRGESFLVGRASRALNHFKARGSVQEVAGVLSSQAEIDATAVESSYTMVKVLIWAIPILGFIGTVLGIGQAVGQFSASIEQVQEIEKIKDSLGGVTSGLAVAFDTTLIALIMSLLIMFPARSLQKSEEDVLNSVDEYANEDLLPRLDEGQPEHISGPGQIKAAVAEAMSEQTAELQGWTKRLETVGDALTQRVVEGWEGVDRQMQASHERQLEEVRGALSSASQGQVDVIARLKEVQDGQAERLAGVVSSMGETASRVQEQVLALQETQIQNFKNSLATVSGELGALQAQAKQSGDSGAAALREIAVRFSESLDGLGTRAESAQNELLEGVRATSSALREQMQGLPGEIRQAFGEQLASLGQTQRGVEEMAEKFAAHLEQTRSDHARGLGQAAEAMGESTRQLLKQAAAGQEEPLRRIEEISMSLGQQARAIQQEMGAARETLTEVSKQVAQELSRAGQANRQDADEQLNRLSSTGNEMVSGIVASQQKLADQMSALAALLEGEGKLAAMQQTLASNLELVATSDSFKQTLAGLERGLGELARVVERFGEQEAFVLPAESIGDGHPRGLGGRIWRRLRGGGKRG